MTKTATTKTGKTGKKAAKVAEAAFPAIVEETRVIKGIRLPWERVERYGPQLNRHTNTMTDHPPKGTVLESGEVFIEMSTLYDLSEQDVWDSQFGSVLTLGYHEGMALEQAGLAVEETRGGFHRTERLMKFLKHYENRG